MIGEEKKTGISSNTNITYGAGDYWCRNCNSRFTPIEWTYPQGYANHGYAICPICRSTATEPYTNQKNKHIFKTSKYPGVHWEDSRKKWHASIRINGKKTFLGRFDIEEDAYSAYKKAVESIGEKVI
jgi:hypothetical protein